MYSPADTQRMGGVPTISLMARSAERRDSLKKKLLTTLRNAVRVRPRGIAQVGFDIEREPVT